MFNLTHIDTRTMSNIMSKPYYVKTRLFDLNGMGWLKQKRPTALFQTFACCVLASFLLCACWLLAACLMPACCVIAACLLIDCCVLATCMMRAWCVLDACLLCAWFVLACVKALLDVLNAFLISLQNSALPEDHLHMPMGHLPVAVISQIW